jgi:ATP-dependent DNA helicase 2 subunit 2
MNKVIVLLLTICIAINVALAKEKHIKYKEKDLMRKSIVYDKNTPDVFYCPINKPTGMDKMIVK